MHVTFVFLCFSLLPCFFSVDGVVVVFVPPFFLCALGLGPFIGILTAVLPAVMDAMSMALLAPPRLLFCPLVRAVPIVPLPACLAACPSPPCLARLAASVPVVCLLGRPSPPPVCPSPPCLARLSALPVPALPRPPCRVYCSPVVLRPVCLAVPSPPPFLLLSLCLASPTCPPSVPLLCYPFLLVCFCCAAPVIRQS